MRQNRIWLLSVPIILALLVCTADFGKAAVRTYSPNTTLTSLQRFGELTYVEHITWKVVDVDYVSRTIIVKDWVGLEGRHILRLPPGAIMPFEGQLCPGFRDGFTYYIKIGGEWYSWS